jgi:hypothetical protein
MPTVENRDRKGTSIDARDPIRFRVGAPKKGSRDDRRTKVLLQLNFLTWLAREKIRRILRIARIPASTQFCGWFSFIGARPRKKKRDRTCGQ